MSERKSDSTRSLSLLVFYHYLYPDNVVSSIHLSELCAGLAERGWSVKGVACNRGCRDESLRYPPRSVWRGVEFRHIWRPRVSQRSTAGRLINAVWMIGAWSLAALDPRLRADVVVAGTDPALTPLIALPWRLVRPRARLAHWCFDLYPEAAQEAGLLNENAIPVRALRRLLERAYRRFDLLVDIGECMRRRLALYRPSGRNITIVPWALAEPAAPVRPDPEERAMLFGGASLGLLYSGSFGRAHSAALLGELAAALAPHGGRLAFSVAPESAARLRGELGGSAARAVFAPLCPAGGLERRLGAADAHIVSLREGWTGAVVPSKFFGALAIGRPVLFVGSDQSAIAGWIREFGVGWTLNQRSIERTVDNLRELAASDEKKQRLFARCRQVYQSNFNRERCLDRWDESLRGLFA